MDSDSASRTETGSKVAGCREPVRFWAKEDTFPIPVSWVGPKWKKVSEWADARAGTCKASSHILVTFKQNVVMFTRPSGTAQVFLYRQSLYAGTKMAKGRPLGATTAVEVCSKIGGTEVNVRVGPRTHIGNPVTGEVVCALPVGQGFIWQKLTEWAATITSAGRAGKFGAVPDIYDGLLYNYLTAQSPVG